MWIKACLLILIPSLLHLVRLSFLPFLSSVVPDRVSLLFYSFSLLFRLLRDLHVYMNFLHTVTPPCLVCFRLYPYHMYHLIHLPSALTATTCLTLYPLYPLHPLHPLHLPRALSLRSVFATSHFQRVIIRVISHSARTGSPGCGSHSLP